VAVHFVKSEITLTLAVGGLLTFIAVYFILYQTGKAANLGTKVSGNLYLRGDSRHRFLDGMFGRARGSFFTLANGCCAGPS